METMTRDLMNAAMREWPSLLATLSRSERHRITTELMSLAVHAARLAAYANARDLERSHEESVGVQNRVALAVRRALGYAYARDPVTF